MSDLVKMSYEDWEETFKPIDNPFSPGEQLFQIPSSDAEVAFLENVDVSKIWTYGSGEYGGTYIWSGENSQGLENFGAYVTLVGYVGESIIEVEFFEPEYDCPNCETSFIGDEAIEQRKNYEDSCENCENS